MKRMLRRLKNGNIGLFGVTLKWNLQRTKPSGRSFNPSPFELPYRIHLGPGPNWTKPNNHWINVDIDPKWGDMVVDFQNFQGFPLKSDTTACIYGSHVFEHMSTWVADIVFSECYRVLQPGGVLRLILPDAEKSIREYLAGNQDFPLFRRRRERAKARYNLEYTLFDCLREDFLSRAAQTALLGQNALAHQNAWDFASISSDLRRAGFSKIHRCDFKQSTCDYFGFEGSYECEALQNDRSLYVEAVK